MATGEGPSRLGGSAMTSTLLVLLLNWPTAGSCLGLLLAGLSSGRCSLGSSGGLSSRLMSVSVDSEGKDLGQWDALNRLLWPSPEEPDETVDTVLTGRSLSECSMDSEQYSARTGSWLFKEESVDKRGDSVVVKTKEKRDND